MVTGWDREGPCPGRTQSEAAAGPVPVQLGSATTSSLYRIGRPRDLQGPGQWQTGRGRERERERERRGGRGEDEEGGRERRSEVIDTGQEGTEVMQDIKILP
eukprot:34538-Hanusia_phi.AAC.1